ncbi:intraflagellar transport protein 52 homolog isoform X2 [Homalodisca vitripennis]|uniref:intraflagellar transport protein 52 homolog isoform X2 n=1 Tax=Homalodisca vitripennis TaxID=197043 RepID=UPI001EEC2297|nr:intraflagellar transport protein 52 homolog isoform X2 [Homalodisca vitripennis]
MVPTEVESSEKLNTILFNQSKNELFKLNDNYKILQRKLKGNWKVTVNKDEISGTILSGVSVFVIAAPRERFTESEFNVMKKYLDSGGSLLVLVTEGGEKTLQTNINFLLEEYGIMVNNDCVVRTHYFKYFHPKECLVANGVLNRGIAQHAGKKLENFSQALSFVYPFGATLNIARPAVAVLSSGTVAFPLNRPVMAFCALPSRTRSGHPESGGGKLVVLGSCHLFSDSYIDKEDNDKLREVIFAFLTSDNVQLNTLDSDDPEITDYCQVPDTCHLADLPRGCLQEAVDDVPTDYTRLFDHSLSSVNMDMVPAVLAAYEELQVKHEPLKLIPPQFESPLPPLQPAVFPPSFRDLPPPALELFDLEEAFSSDKARLSQLANKCLGGGVGGGRVGGGAALEDEIADLEYWIREAGRIIGVGSPTDDAAKILHAVALLIAEFKKNNVFKEEKLI